MPSQMPQHATFVSLASSFQNTFPIWCALPCPPPLVSLSMRAPLNTYLKSQLPLSPAQPCFTWTWVACPSDYEGPCLCPLPPLSEPTPGCRHFTLFSCSLLHSQWCAPSLAWAWQHEYHLSQSVPLSQCTP